MDECGGMRTATLLVAIMILAPFAQAVDSPYSGNRELIVQPNPNGELSNLTEDAFSIPANSTILDGWVNVSTGSNGDGGSGTHWNANSPTLNFSHGTFSDSSISEFILKFSFFCISSLFSLSNAIKLSKSTLRYLS